MYSQLILFLFLFLFLVNHSFSLIAYFKIEISCGNDYPLYIESSEANYYPINPKNIPCYERTDFYYIFKFNEIMHNMESPLCIKFVGVNSQSGLAFYNIAINEYDITFLNPLDFYYCNDCYIKRKKGFKLDGLCQGKPQIFTTEIPSKHTICLKPTNDISIFYIDESRINQNYYNGKIIKYI